MKSFFCGGFIVCILAMASVISGESQAQYKINDTVELSGYITESIYLSTTGTSDKEYMNTAHCLKLEKGIDIADDNNPAKIYKNIDLIELENYHEFYRLLSGGGTVKIRGILKTFETHTGYYRQYSTPVKMEITRVY